MPAADLSLPVSRCHGITDPRAALDAIVKEVCGG